MHTNISYSSSALAILIGLTSFFSASNGHAHEQHHWEKASKDPDRIFLSFYGDAATSRAVTWRTSSAITNAVAEIAPALGEPGFDQFAEKISATTEVFDLSKVTKPINESVNYHSAIFSELKPDTLYAYRVGDGQHHWSEWIQFRTASDKPKPFEFVYFGDAQNDVMSRWSRVIRMAHQTAPHAQFALHAGDLINKSNADDEWAGWFKSGGFLHSQWTGIPVVGNHEFQRGRLSMLWKPQFTLPRVDAVSERLQETVYTVEYQDLQLIVLNSLTGLEEQTLYLEDQLKKPRFRWRMISLHFPVFGPTKRKNNVLPETIRSEWMAMIEKYQVDMVLQGHDHAYVRGQQPVVDVSKEKEGAVTAVYVTSVSGPKQYPPNKEHIASYAPDNFSATRIGANTQFFQVIGLDENVLTYRAFTATGELYDQFKMEKDFKTGSKKIIQQIPDTPERTSENTVKYSKENL